MAKKLVKLTFPQKLIKEPLTFEMAKKYNIMPNIRRAKVTEQIGELVLELEGKDQDLISGGLIPRCLQRFHLKNLVLIPRSLLRGGSFKGVLIMQ